MDFFFSFRRTVFHLGRLREVLRITETFERLHGELGMSGTCPRLRDLDFDANRFLLQRSVER